MGASKHYRWSHQGLMLENNSKWPKIKLNKSKIRQKISEIRRARHRTSNCFSLYFFGRPNVPNFVFIGATQCFRCCETRHFEKIDEKKVLLPKLYRYQFWENPMCFCVPYTSFDNGIRQAIAGNVWEEGLFRDWSMACDTPILNFVFALNNSIKYVAKKGRLPFLS